MKIFWKQAIKAMLVYLIAIVTVGSPVHAAAANVPFTPEPDQGLFMLISDLHFDPFASSDVVKRINTAPPDRWKAILDRSQKTAFAQYGNDANYPLLMSTIKAAKSLNINADFILFPGDYLAHDFSTRYRQQVGGSASQYAVFVENTIRFVDQRLHDAFPKTPIISALGNNDSLCGDYKIAPCSPLLKKLSGLWALRSGAPPEAIRTFAVGGFYTTPHPTVPSQEIIVLNNILWSYKYKDECNVNGGDPGGAQMAWLEWTLYRLKQEKKTATLVMHVPPGVNAYTTSKSVVPGQSDCKEKIQLFWADTYASRFEVLAKKYQEILGNGFVGHTHMDDFRVVFSADKSPFLFARISPAVSPVFGNNPAFTLVLYDRKTGQLLDYAVYELTNLKQAGRGEPAHWKMEYSFRAVYGLSDVTPATLATLSDEIGNGGNASQKYVRFYAVEAMSGIGNDIKAYECAQSNIGPAEFAGCYCGQ